MHSFSRFRKDSLPVLSRFSSGVYYFSRPQDYCMPMGRSDSCFCLLLRGEVEVRCAQTVLIARRGQLLYWPEGVPYHSFWKPENGLISYIAVYFRLHGHLNRREGAVQPGVFLPAISSCYCPKETGCARFEAWPIIIAGRRPFRSSGRFLHTLPSAYAPPAGKSGVPAGDPARAGLHGGKSRAGFSHGRVGGLLPAKRKPSLSSI